MHLVRDGLQHTQGSFPFGSGTDRILRKTAGWFFYDYSVISQEYGVVLVHRITEKGRSGSNQNLTSDYFADCLRKQGKATSEIDSLHDALQEYARRVIQSRRKLVAHRDKAALTKGIPHSEWPLEEVDKFLQNLNKFCDAVAIQVGVDPLDFLATNAPGDAMDLVRALAKTDSPSN